VRIAWDDGQPSEGALDAVVHIGNGNRVHDAGTATLNALCEFGIVENLHSAFKTHATADFVRGAANVRPAEARSVVAAAVDECAGQWRRCVEACAESCAADPTSPWFAFDAASAECLLMADGADVNTTVAEGWQWFEKVYGTAVLSL